MRWDGVGKLSAAHRGENHPFLLCFMEQGKSRRNAKCAPHFTRDELSFFFFFK